MIVSPKLQKAIFALFVCAFSHDMQAGTLGEESFTAIDSNGFYIAGNIGVQNLFDNESHTLYPEHHQLGALGVVGGGFLGYSYSLGQQTGVSLEFFADATGVNTSISHNPTTYQMNQRYDLGLRLLPEYHLNEHTTAHVMLGYVNGHFNISDNGVYGTVSNAFNASGFQTGLGLTVAHTEHLMTRIDMLYNLYASNSSTGLWLVPPARQTYNNQFNGLIAQLAFVYKC